MLFLKVIELIGDVRDAVTDGGDPALEGLRVVGEMNRRGGVIHLAHSRLRPG